MSEDYLIHYGILGMKWGVRKKNYNFIKSMVNKQQKYKGEVKWNKSYKKEDRTMDRFTFGKNGTKRINNRMNKGQSYKKAYAIELGRSAATIALISLAVGDYATGGAMHRAAGKKIFDSYVKI